MKKIFFAIIFVLFCGNIKFAAAQNATKNLPNNQKIDVESLGLDAVEDKKRADEINASIQKNIEKVQSGNNTKIEKLPTKNNNASSEQNQGERVEILSKIQEFVSSKKVNFFKKSDKNIAQKNNDLKNKKTLDKKTPTEKKQNKKNHRDKFRQRLENERKIVADKNNQKLLKNNAKNLQEYKETKASRLKKLREEYLIKLDKNNNFYDENQEIILPEKKSFRWSDRFNSYETPPAPIVDNYRGNDNKHIPTIPTTQDKIDLLFHTITTSDTNYFNSAYRYLINPDLKNRDGETILTYAILLQKYGVISSILEKGADPDLANSLGHTPLDIAIEMMDLKTAQILIDMNADCNYIDGLGRSYLMHAARVGFLPMVQLLVEQKVDVNATDNQGITALSIAYKHKKDIIAKFLLKSGAKSWIEIPAKSQDQILIKELENRWKVNNL